MNWTSYAKAALAVLLLVSLSGNEGCDKPFRLDLERIPQHYRDCVAKVTTLPRGSLTYNEAVALLATIRKSELRLSACGKATIAWADAQVAAYGK